MTLAANDQALLQCPRYYKDTNFTKGTGHCSSAKFGAVHSFSAFDSLAEMFERSSGVNTSAFKAAVLND
jgi:hypothetical protein